MVLPGIDGNVQLETFQFNSPVASDRFDFTLQNRYYFSVSPDLSCPLSLIYFMRECGVGRGGSADMFYGMCKLY